jgi:hypothetical protein
LGVPPFKNITSFFGVRPGNLVEFWPIFQDVLVQAQGCNLGKLDPLGDYWVSLGHIFAAEKLELGI